MKNTMPAVLALVALLAGASSAGADDTGPKAAGADTTSVSLGLKLWSSTWKEDANFQTGRTADFDNGTGLLVGPTINVRFFKDWFVDVTYLKSLDDFESSNWFTTGDSMKFEDMTHMDAKAGYLIQDPYNSDFRAGFFALYKKIEASASYTNQKAGFGNVNIGTWKLSGPGLGVLVQKQLDQATTLGGNLSYLFLEKEFVYASGALSRFDSNGWSLELTAERIIIKGLSVSLGVEYERFKGEATNGDDFTDSFYGLNGGIRYTF